MQKKLIALAVAGLMSGAAFAQTSVTIGGKVDAGYQFKKTANADASGGSTGGKTTETLSDGSASTSRITVGAKETINSDLEAGVSIDLRFSDFFDGKATNNSTTSTVAGVGGLTSNDKKAVYLSSKMLGRVQWGVQNFGDDFYVASKPYMVEPKDLEFVKYGVSSYRMTALSNRTTQYLTPTLSLGSFKIGGQAVYAIGDNRKGGNNNVDATGSGDVLGGGFQFAFGKVVNGGYDYLSRASTGVTDATEDGLRYQRAFVSVFPIGGLKLAGTYSTQNGRARAVNTAFQDKITNAVVSYNFNDKASVGVEYSIVRDVGSNRNSGHGWMMGGAYFLTKSVYVYGAVQKSDWERNENSVGGYDGTADAFGATRSATKRDERYTRVGFVKEF
ncbi:porin [Uliginosibacterium aquaticum]|uniref:Porin n=1 Tax=Uliginosibacterium aquaticum TaxID=2731212 RepID=A0ABX2IP36_9RHOO|nr:porin [Uliginosibacterium aquaticum]NSL56454.1 porin [Uliginosibacterium aquaticum]